MNIYQENVMDHYKNPRNFGKMKKPDVVSKDANMLCGDEIEIQVKIKNGKIDDIRFSGPGCAISRASGSMLSELVKGKKISDIKKIKDDDLIGMMGIELTPIRRKCALLSLRVLKNGLEKA
ncbi:SUF system NifU family Fe-S cluster assembly protein [Candidatus Micrarchaeota archaeon RBG_16_49_10]|nr:MAG: SUF system NifU family Fe-S cluster assembly protein [Candidatus Micrarchaeota archaeon RBG_16_49_10]